MRNARRKLHRGGLIALACAAVLGIAPMQLGSLNFGGFTGMASASAAVQPVATPDPVFSGTLTSQQQTEMMAWGQAYWNKVEGVVGPGGTNAALGGFTFSTAAMNSPLFNPFYGPRQTLVNLGLIAESDCMKQLAEAPGMDAASLVKQSAIKDALLEAKFKTDPVTDPTGTFNHINKIFDSGYVANLVIYTEDGKLVSKELPLDVLVGAGMTVELADSLSADTVTALLVLSSQVPAIVANAAGLTEATGMLGTQARKADAVATAIRNLLTQAGVQSDGVERMDVLFGVYGQLPTVYVALSDCAVLIDATTGAMTNPIKPGTPLNAGGLLALHPFAATSPFAHRMVSAAGCTLMVAPTWQDQPPAPGLVPTPPRSPGTPPGNWGNWNCIANVGGGCTCVTEGQYQDPPTTPPTTPPTIPRKYPVRVICTDSAQPPGSGNCPSASPMSPFPVPTPPPPATAPKSLTTPGNYPTADCKFQYKY